MKRIKELGLIIDLNAIRELSCGYMMSPTAGMVVEVEVEHGLYCTVAVWR
jgi:hypothetical protein